jgi:hypothetical protein
LKEWAIIEAQAATSLVKEDVGQRLSYKTRSHAGAVVVEIEGESWVLGTQ